MSDLNAAKPLTLKSGVTLPNRLVKAAMAEQMSGSSHKFLPSPDFLALYRQWARAGWGMILTGVHHGRNRFSCPWHPQLCMLTAC
jgi:2,4-dienoyl-CoA reductase-like NADH-dependent reductase (Old Yellow Enzyme family)